MVVKNYSFTLEKEVIDEVKETLGIKRKLSPFINDLLKDWLNNIPEYIPNKIEEVKE
jgi:hypothetical protein